MSAMIINQPTSYLFVDGGCVRAELKALSRKYYGEPDRAQIAWSSFSQNYTKIFYYDALPARLDDEDDRQYEERNSEIIELHSNLRNINGFHVYEGDVRRARSRRERPQQKKVDVMIAVDMLLHTFRRNMNLATLIASDLDFSPLLHALVREGMYVTLWYPPSATSEELRAAADARRKFIPSELGSALITVDGQPLIPTWNSGILHYNQQANINQRTFTSEEGYSLIITGNSHIMGELFNPTRTPMGYASHHSGLALLISVEEQYKIRFPESAFAEFGGRPS